MWRVYLPTVWNVVPISLLVHWCLREVIERPGEWYSVESLLLLACSVVISVVSFHLLVVNVLWYWCKRKGYEKYTVAPKFHLLSYKVLLDGVYRYEIEHAEGKFMICLSNGKMMYSSKRVKKAV